ncbi:hypothetical protein [Treponema sp.]|uniref:hypothetical protein n=1 Tax=Treponema sp. TaxID=166 RepID=UPI00388E2C1C
MKNTVDLLLKKMRSAVLVTAVISALISCGEESGLGSSVDTESPKVSISYPPAAAVVRDTFILGGSWSDDKSVSSVAVTVTNKTTNTQVYSGNASVNSSGTWYIELNSYDSSAYSATNGYEFPDGTYSVDAVATDGAGRTSSTASVSFDIDNTPPVLLLTKPLAFGDETATSYGRTLKLTGDVSEEHSYTLTLLARQDASYDASAASHSEDELSSLIQFENLSVTSMSSDSPLVVAKYYGTAGLSDSQQESQNRYEQIYGTVDTETDPDTDPNVTKYFYAGFVLTDEACVYQDKNLSKVVNAGNSTKRYYLNTDSLSASLNAISDDIKIKDIREVLNGTSATYTTGSDECTAILQALASQGNYIDCDIYQYDSDGRYSYDASGNKITVTDIESVITTSANIFCLDPDNYPTWKIASYSLGTDNNTYAKANGFRSYTSGQNLGLTITPNADGSYVAPQAVALKYGAVELTTTRPETTDGYYSCAGTETTYYWQEPSEWTYIFNKGDWTDSSTNESATKDFSISGTTAGIPYMFALEGEDRDGNEYVAYDLINYGFLAATSGTAPTIRITSDSGDYLNESTFYNNGNGYTISGTMVDEDGLWASNAISATVKIYEGGDTSGTEITSLSPSFTITYSSDNSSDSTVYTSASDAQTASTSKVLWNVNINSENPEGSLYPAASGMYTYVVTVTAQNSQSLSDSETFTFYLDSKAPSLYALKVGGKMFIGGSATDEDFNTVDLVEQDSEWFSNSAQKLLGYYEEYYDGESSNGSGIDEIYYWIQTASGTAPSTSDYSTANGSFVAAKDSSKNYKSKFSTTVSGFEAGSNTLYLVAVDKAGNASVPSTCTVQFDEDDPEVTASTVYFGSDDTTGQSASGTVLTNGENYMKLTGTCSDISSGVDTITILQGTEKLTSYTAGDFSTEGVSISDTANSDGTYDWSLYVKAESLGTGNIILKVSDIAGNSAKITAFTLNTDTTSPVVVFKSTGADSDNKINGEVTITGTARDFLSETTKSSGTADGTLSSIKLYYAIADSQPEADAADTWYQLSSESDSTTTSDSSVTWSFEQTFSSSTAIVTAVNNSLSLKADSSTETVNLYIKAVAVDAAGNSGYAVENVIVDRNTDRPVIQITSIESADDYLTASTLRGSVSDDDGISSFAISTDGTNYTDVTVAASGSWAFDLSEVGDGTVSLYFKVTDTEGTTFTTGAAASQFVRPYYTFDSSTNNDCSSSLSIRKDTASPNVGQMGISIAESTGSLATPAAVNSASADYAISAKQYTGGDSKYFRLYVPVYDENGIASVKISFADSDDSSTEENGYGYYDDDNGAVTPAVFSSSNGAEFILTTVESSSVSGAYYYKSYPLISTGVATGTKIATLTVTDSAGNTSTKTFNFSVDNTGPDTITVTSPSSTDEITGTATITGTASDSGIGISNIEWLIPPAGFGETDSSSINYKSDSQLSELDGWTSSNNNGSASVFKFKFTSGSITDLTAYDDENAYDVTYNSTAQTYKIPIFFRTTDELGNEYIYRDYYITHNPDADRPVTEFSYPTESDYDSDCDTENYDYSYITLSGTIRVSGTVEVPSGTVDVGKVYIQIGKPASDGTVTWSSSEFADEFTTLGGTLSKSDLTAAYGTTTYVDDDWWGIAATTKTATWNISLNSDSNLNPSSSDATTDIAVRACAINADGKMGNWSDTYYIHVDSSAPSQTALMRQYDFSSATENLVNLQNTDDYMTVSKDYASEMYLKGTWYLVVTLSDNDSLVYNTIKVKRGSASATFYASSEIDLSNSSGVTNTLYIPIETASMTTSSVSYTVYAEDVGGHSSTGTYTFYIDNTAPSLSAISGNGDELSVNAENAVSESNYVYTISGTVKDTGSGYERVLFYFMRNGKIYGSTNSFGKNYILDPLVTDWSSTDDSKALISGLEAITVENDYTIYALKAVTSGSITSSVTDGTTYYSFTDNSGAVSGNGHVHAGGLIYISGEYGKITDVTGSTVTFTMDADPSGATTVYFPYAQSVDNTSTEDVSSTTANPFTFSSGDDGDLMPESISNVSTTWTWKATIHSTNIPDGPAYLVVLAYDAAGNVSGATYPVSIENNAPRLAKLYLGTDLNSDNSFASEEFSQYDVYTANETAGVSTTGYKSAASIATADYEAGQFTAKDKLAVVPEITGGNGSVYMVYKRGASDTTAVTGTTDDSTLISAAASVTTASTAETANISTSPYSVTGLSVIGGDSLYAYTLSSSQVWADTASDSSDKTAGEGVSFTFWDETEERTAGNNSQYCTAYVSDLIINLADTTVPVTAINPFYWTSAEDNSLYNNSTSNGHIELENDLSSGIKALYDSDSPKVSGKVKITGSAYDNKMLHTIALKAAGFSFNGGTAGNALTFATYDGTSWALTSGSESSTAGGAIATDGWQFEINSDSVSQSGHTVTWTLYLDTEKHANVAAKAVAVESSATDWASKTQAASDLTSASSTIQTTSAATTPYYKMDIVPYIAGVKTSLSSLKKANSSVYDRTALGHYPTGSADTVYLYGFNLTGGTLYDSASTPASSTLTEDVASSQSWYSTSSSGTTANFFATSTNTAVYTADVSSFTSGGVYVTVNSVQSLNNLNSDDATGAYTYSGTIGTTGSSEAYANYYNRQPNGDSNNLLTDDVVLDVWAINSKAAATYNGGTISQPVMSINQANGQVGFAFVNGPLYFSMGNTSNSYQYWIGGIDFFTSVGFAYDRLGYSYGTTAGGDVGGTPSSGTDATTFDQFRIMTSRWGTALATVGGYNDGTNQFRLENIGQKDWTITDSSYSSYANINKERIKSPSIATTIKTSDNTTNVYLAYYDAINGEIRFTRGNFGATSRTDNSGFFSDVYGRWGGTSEFVNKIPQPYTLKYTSLIAGQSGESNRAIAIKSGSSYVDGLKYGSSPSEVTEDSVTNKTTSAIGSTSYSAEYASTSTGYYAGEYVHLAALEGAGTDGDDLVAVVWYDSTNQVMWYSYTLTPNSIAAGDYQRSQWSEPEQIFSDTGVGKYCKVAVDANGGIHMVAYDAINGDVCYAYKTSYNGSTSTCVVDSNGIIGTQLSLDVALDSNNNSVPYIGYYAGSSVRPKVAYWAGSASIASTSSKAGASDDAFTQVWEISLVPTSSSVNDDYVNVGVWKTTSTDATYTAVPSKITASSSSLTASTGVTDSGVILGNGTANPILGYGIENASTGYIETAQMQ